MTGIGGGGGGGPLADIDKLVKQINDRWHCRDVRCKATRIENAKLREALEFYAKDDAKLSAQASDQIHATTVLASHFRPKAVLGLIARVEAAEKKLKCGHAWNDEVKKQTYELIDAHDKIQKDLRALLKDAHAALDGYVESDEMLNHVDAEVLRDKIEAALK